MVSAVETGFSTTMKSRSQSVLMETPTSSPAPLDLATQENTSKSAQEMFQSFRYIKLILVVQGLIDFTILQFVM